MKYLGDESLFGRMFGIYSKRYCNGKKRHNGIFYVLGISYVIGMQLPWPELVSVSVSLLYQY